MGARTAAPRQPCVYVMQREDGSVKVGITVLIERRRYQIEQNFQQKVKIFAHIATETFRVAYQIEQMAHSALNEHRITGEWFSCSAEAAVTAVQEASSQIMPPAVATQPLRTSGIILDSPLVRAGRRLLGWTTADLASRAGLSAACIRSLERGSSDPKISTIVAVQRALEAGGVLFLKPGDASPEGKGVRFKV